MEVGMSLNPLVRLPLSSHGRMHDDSVIQHSQFSTTSRTGQKPKHHRLMVVEAKGKKGMAARQYQRKPPPPPSPNSCTGLGRNDEKEIQKMAMKQFRVLRSATEFRYGYKLVENNNVRAAVAANDVIELPTQDELKTVLDKVKDFFGDAKESFGKMTFLNTGDDSSQDEDAKEAPTQKPKEKSPVKS